MDFPTSNRSSDQTLAKIQTQSTLNRTYHVGQQSFNPVQIYSPSDFDPLQQSRILFRYLSPTLPLISIGSGRDWVGRIGVRVCGSSVHDL